MATCHSNEKSLTAAVGYLRRSTSRQEKSLTDQRHEVERYAEQHGYNIVRWYQDDAISGDATACRAGFQAMHKAACNGRDFDVIIVWDSDRFGRFNSIEAGYWIHPLMQAGVKLETVTDGPVDWDNFAGRIVNAVKQEGKHQFLVDLSRNVARGLISRASKGQLCGQAAPYGFDRMLTDEHGSPKQRLRSGEKFGKPRSWTTTLVASDDPVKVETIRWLFRTYADTDTGLRSLADKLNAKGIAGPSGGAWFAASIKAILENQNYTGTFTWAKRREGKYHRVSGGEIQHRPRAEVKLSPGGKPNAIDNPRESWIVVKDAHEALIDHELFERSQVKMKQRARSQPGIGYATHTKQNGDAYKLSGLVYCAQCGCKMHGSTLIAKGKRYPKYLCSTYARSGKSNPSGCGCHGVLQDQLVGVVAEKLQTLVIGKSYDHLKTAIRKQLAARHKPTPNQAADLRRKLAELTKEIDKAAENFLRAPADLLDIIAGKLSSMKRQQETLRQELQQAERQTTATDLETDVERIASRIWQLGDELRNAAPDRQREVFRQVVERIDLRFGKHQRGKRVECPLISGEITLRSDEGSIFGSVSRGDRS